MAYRLPREGDTRDREDLRAAIYWLSHLCATLENHAERRGGRRVIDLEPVVAAGCETGLKTALDVLWQAAESLAAPLVQVTEERVPLPVPASLKALTGGRRHVPRGE